MAAGSRRFPHDERMRHRWEFERVRKCGLTVRGRSMTLSLAACPDRLERRVGFIVTRHYGGAVKRNLVRRRMREIYRLNRCRLKRGVHLVLIARSSDREWTYRQMNEEFLSLYRTAVTRLCGNG
ncbi:MAG: ribonuclease P protein component [Gemmatimonadetes bacterium]|nr:ribonuclease P protein component [Gemmatimonadota bacterium]